MLTVFYFPYLTGIVYMKWVFMNGYIYLICDLYSPSVAYPIPVLYGLEQMRCICPKKFANHMSFSRDVSLSTIRNISKTI